MTSAENREREVVEVFAELSDALVGSFDVMELLHVVSLRCCELLECAEAGMLLSVEGDAGSLRVVGSSSERAEALEMLQALNQRGPCVDCWRRGEVVICEDLGRHCDRWPAFAPVALERGVRAVHSLPMRSHDEMLGVLNLFRDRPGRLPEEDTRLAQGLADLAVVALIHDRSSRERDAVVGQLQGALNSRVVIEQAKGALSVELGISVEDAFDLLRQFARRHNRLLAGVAGQLLDGTLDPLELSGATAGR